MCRAKEEIARDLYCQGCNCAQAVFVAFAEELGVSRETAAKIALPFGGGMATGDTCGALTGALMALGLTQSGCVPPAQEDKAASRQEARRLAEAFAERYGTTLCRELLATPEGRDKKICPELVAFMAKELAKLLQEKNQ